MLGSLIPDELDELLAMPNEELGKRVWAEWLRLDAMREGLDPSALTLERAESVRLEVLYGHVTGLNNAALEKVLKTAASTDASTAGALFKQLMRDGVIAVGVLQDAALGHKSRQRSRSGGRSRANQRAEENADRDKKIKKDYADLLTRGRSAREIPGILAQRYGLSPKQIRRIAKPK